MKSETIRHIQSLGFKVYMRKLVDMWLVYERGGKIGYFQAPERALSCSVSTMHRPCHECGTGFRMADTSDCPTENELVLGFAFSPNWAMGSQHEAVVKYKDIEDFRKSSKWNEAYRLVSENVVFEEVKP